MTVPSYEVGRVAALTVRLVLASGLSREEARAALGLASAMMDEDSSLSGRGTTLPPRHPPARAESSPAERVRRA